jgi:dTDP-4-amino-4,6-dideoxygalactose transaminase
MGDDRKSIPLFGVVNLPEMEQAALDVLRSGRIASGEYVSKFEDGLGQLLGQKNVVTTVDMTSAMYLALHLSDVKAGDEVITTAFACMATNSPISTIGAKPIWVDLEEYSACISIADFEAAITPNTKAAILYHLAGYPGPARQISDICKKHGIKLIEDCDNALLAEVDDGYVGSFGDFAIYSFYPNRQINTTEGGALVCKNQKDALRARNLRRLGIDASTFRMGNGEINPESDIPEVGWSITLNNLCSAIGVAQINSVDERLERTRKNAKYLIESLSKTSGVTILASAPNSLPAYWALLIQVEERDSLFWALKSSGISCSQLHQRNDAYSGFTGNARNLPNTTRMQKSVLALPCGWWLSSEEVEFVASQFKQSLIKISAIDAN